ncbi:aminoacyl-tRNA hydrolase [Eubacteriales bacterium OttesenSCG-928-N14]|nr:aminoacyl-tRNA hydrolase [Eubacteriales bacterium OttesenSCG-928-N14]
MKLIFGLGNPGKKYENTMHNMGFLAADAIVEKMGGGRYGKLKDALIYKGRYEGERVFVIKPQTYMNRSGDCVWRLMDYYKVDEADILVIYDDIDLPVGSLRMRSHGSAGTHNGMRDIIAKLGANEFARIRVGIGKPPEGWDLVDYVLSGLKGEQKELLLKTVDRAADAALAIVSKGMDYAGQHFNGTIEGE